MSKILWRKDDKEKGVMQEVGMQIPPYSPRIVGFAVVGFDDSSCSAFGNLLS